LADRLTSNLCMTRNFTFSFIIILIAHGLSLGQDSAQSWIRINLAGYKPASVKVAVFCAKSSLPFNSFELVDTTNKTVYRGKEIKSYGAYGPFKETARLDFSSFKQPGRYHIRVGKIVSPEFVINENAYSGIADYCLKYMRQQRSGFNPYLKDSCHTQDGYTMYGPMADSSHIDVSGGWHDATDYLQYAMTSANATFHLLAAARDFPQSFSDMHQANGLAGENAIPDVLDEARWGLDWLLKMHPREDWMFNQLADDRDHIGFRLPTQDKAKYGKGRERPVYFLTGKQQGLGKYKNETTGTSSTAAKFSSAFALGYEMFQKIDRGYAEVNKERSLSAYKFALRKEGYTQTACYSAPYYYEESNWVDDMELASVYLSKLTQDPEMIRKSLAYAKMEQQTPWFSTDTARHYQWYPFINLGHFELAKISKGRMRREVISFYQKGIEQVYERAKSNAFLRGVPYIWCSNNLQTSFAIQCIWYESLTGDLTFQELTQATFDFLLGCNPWGSSMIVGYPSNGDYPDDPHSSLNVLFGMQTEGGLVDGPVYGSIFTRQLGVSVVRGDEYSSFQSDLVVYHDDYGDYVTNEPTMDGTAALIYLLAAFDGKGSQPIKRAGTQR
jgi:endoglucanase